MGFVVSERLEALSDRRLLFLCAAAIFVACAWPLVLVELPPYQDVPNHIASVIVMENPAEYPAFVANGLFKTNAAVYAWVHLLSGVMGHVWAMRLFIVFLLATGAFAYPSLLLEISGRRAMVMGSLFAPPFVHNWFVAMGMLNFALGVAFAMLTIVAMQRARSAPSVGGRLLVALLGVATWYAHAVPFTLLLLLFLVELAVAVRVSRKDGLSFAKHAGLPLGIAVAVALVRRVSDLGSGKGGFIYTPPWTSLYNLWAEWAYSFTPLGAATIVSCGLLLVLALRRFREKIPFFSPASFVVLILLFAAAPHSMAGAYYFNARVAGFLWLAMLVRVPPELPRPVVAGLVAIMLSFSASLGIDFVRLSRERAQFDEGIPHVAERAQLLPFIFDRKGSSANTRHMMQAWGTYTLEKHAAAPLVFAHSRTYGVSYSTPPPELLDHVELELQIDQLGSEAAFCANDQEKETCAARYRERWQQLYDVVTPRFDHLLFWGASNDVLANVPAPYARVFERGKLVIYARKGPRGAW